MTRLFNALVANVVLVTSALIGCVDTLDPPARGEAGTVEQPVLNGTTAPQITNLTAGEVLAIGFIAERDGSPFCSGTLIDRDVVLTAQHCVEDSEVDDLRFGIGDPAAPRRLIAVKRLSQAGWERDVALLQLDRDAVDAVSGVQPIAFNRGPLGDGYVGTLAEAAGYHAIDGRSVRRFGVLEIGAIRDTYIRTDPYTDQGVCNGDSGGPLLVHVGDGVPVVAGTAMGGHISCQGEAYFARIDALSDWIDEEMTWFAADGSGVGDGPSIGSRRVPDVCSTVPDRPAPTLPAAILALLAVVAVSRRR